MFSWKKREDKWDEIKNKIIQAKQELHIMENYKEERIKEIEQLHIQKQVLNVEVEELEEQVNRLMEQKQVRLEQIEELTKSYYQAVEKIRQMKLEQEELEEKYKEIVEEKITQERELNGLAESVKILGVKEKERIESYEQINYDYKKLNYEYKLSYDKWIQINQQVEDYKNQEAQFKATLSLLRREQEELEKNITRRQSQYNRLLKDWERIKERIENFNIGP